jgi:hypothetical protein
LTDSIGKWIHAYLETDEAIVVPVRKMWKSWCADHEPVTIEEFTAIVEADPRIEAMPGLKDRDELEDDLGMNAGEVNPTYGPRVKLKTREITLEHIARMIKLHTDQMVSALWSAHEVAPEDLSDEEEADLLSAIATATELQFKLDEAGLMEEATNYKKSGGESDES